MSRDVSQEPRGGRSPTLSVKSAPVRGFIRGSPSPSPLMQEICECHTEENTNNSINEMSTGVEMRPTNNVDDNDVQEPPRDLDVSKNPRNMPKKKQKKIISERQHGSRRPSLSRSISGVLAAVKLRRLSISSPSSPFSNQSCEMGGAETPGDAGNQRESRGDDMTNKVWT